MKDILLPGGLFYTGLIISGMAATQTSCTVRVQHDNQSPPNIILILADDLGYGDLGCYGQDVLKTPYIDQMAAEGMMFMNHYTGSTVCAPSRASLLTGLHTGHVSVRGNSPHQLVGDDEFTIAKALKDAGYVTGIVGKWGIGHPPPTDDPQRKGFDYAYGFINMWHAHNFFPEFLYENGKRVELMGNRLFEQNGRNPWHDLPEGTGVAEQKQQYAPFLFREKSLEFIEQNQHSPFFLFVSLNDPHANNEAGHFLGDGMEVPDYGMYAGMDWPDPEKGFAAMIRNIDETVGAINQKLIECGIEQNTLVIFVSDNGPHAEGHHDPEFFESSGPLRGKKRDMYEGGIRTPFIAKWPYKIKAGSASDHISAFWDYLPTFCEIAGVEVPVHTDGVSFLPALTGKENTQHKHEFLYWEFYERGGIQAARTENWKMLKLHIRTGNPIIELYDLDKDISEQNNLAHLYPEIVNKIDSLMIKAHSPLPFISLFDEQISADTPF